MTTKQQSKRRGPKPSVTTQQVHEVMALAHAVCSYKDALELLGVDPQAFHNARRRAREFAELGAVKYRRVSPTEYVVKVVAP